MENEQSKMNNKIYPTIKDSILLCLLFLGIQIAAGFIMGIFGAILKISISNNASHFVGVSTILISVVAFGVVILIGFKKTKRKFNEVFKFNKVAPILWIAVVVFSIGFGIVLSEFNNFINYFLPMPEMVRSLFDTLMVDQMLIISVIIIIIMPAFAEELLFRGIILDGLINNYSKRKAIIVSALLFGLIHLNPWQFFTGFFIGLFSAWICIKTNSLLLCIYIHLFHNLIGTAAMRLKNIVPIKGINTHASVGEFHALWVNLTGLILLITGIFLLKKGFENNKSVDRIYGNNI